MVFTRTQKRKIDDLQQTNASDENLEVQDDFSNIRLTKKKRKTKKTVTKPVSTKSVCIQTECIQTDTETSDDSFINDESESIGISESESSKHIEENEEGNDETTEQTSNGSEELEKILDESRSSNGEDENEDEDEYENEKISQINYIGSVLSDTIQNVIKQVMNKQDESEVTSKEKDEYDKYIKNVNSIYEGKFFERVPIDEKKRTLKETVSQEKVKQLNDELELIRENYKTSAPSIVDVLNMDIDITQKQKLLENIYKFTNSELLTQEYTSTLKLINDKINKQININAVEI